MKGATVLLSLACLLATLFNSVSAEAPEKLVGAQYAADHEFPHMVSIRNNNFHFCGGTIITNVFILTAAHCVVDITPQNVGAVRVVSGTNSLDYGGEEHGVIDVFVHSRYVSTPETALMYDIALLKLARPMTFNDFQKPISKPDGPPNYRQKAVIAAWGATSWPSRGSSKWLQKLYVNLYPSNVCRQYYSFPVYDIHVCTFAGRHHGVCPGDSGSALIQDGKIIGIVSGGYYCATGVPDIFTNVYTFSDYVEHVVAEHSSYGGSYSALTARASEANEYV